jgi:hypothetical protein
MTGRIARFLASINTTRRQPLELFQVEKPLLCALPDVAPGLAWARGIA